MMTSGRTYGERVRQARIHKGLTQVELAAKIGATAAAVSRMEVIDKCQGSRFTCRIATACGVDPLWLETGAGAMISETYSTTDPRLIAGLKVMEGLPDYAVDIAVKELDQVAELVSRAQADSMEIPKKAG